MPEVDPIDVILRIQNLRKFIADAEAARLAMAKIGASGAEGAAAGASSGALKKAEREKAAQQAAALGLVRKAAIGTGLAVAGIGFEAAKMGIKFDEALLRINTQAGEQKSRLKELELGVIDMAQKVGFGPQSLVDSLYHLESVGIRGRDALVKLKTAADLAGVGHAKLEETTNALAAAYVTGIKGAGDFTHVAAMMNAAVGSGNIRMNELAEALGTGILPAAHVAGLSIQTVFAAIATLTDAGWKASSASAQLATAFHYLYSPTTKAQKALAQMHLTGLDLIKLMRERGLPAALKTLKSHLEQYTPGKTPGEKHDLEAQKVAEIVPGGRGRSLLSLITMDKRLEEKEAFEKAATNKKFAEAVALYHKTAAFKIRAAWSGIQADLTKIGKLLEPVAVIAAHALLFLADSLLWVINGIRNLKHNYDELSGPMKLFVLVVGVIVAQAALFVGVITVWKLLRNAIVASKIAIELFSAASKLAMLTNPWMIAIMAIVVLIVLIATHWTKTKEIAGEVWRWMKQAWKDTVDWVIGAAKDMFNWFKQNWPLLLPILFGPFGFVAMEAIKHWKGLMHFFESIPGTLGKIASAIWDAFTWPFRWALKSMEHLWNKFSNLPGIKQILGAVKWAGSALESASNAVGSVIPGLASGGLVSSPGAVLVGEGGPEIVHLGRGATVQPLSTKSTQDGPVKIMAKLELHVDKKVLAEQIGEFTADKIARR